MKIICHLCGHGTLELVPEYASLKRVASDCKPWPAGGQLGVCSECRTAQAVIDEQWQEECRRIYSSYTIYHQSDGQEQAVYSPGAGIPSARSDYLLAKMGEHVNMPQKGRLLDLGCGNGGFLRSFSKRFPGWRLNGSEYDAKYRHQVESIPGFDQLYLGSIERAEGQFDAVSLIHVLEHIASPRALLRQIHERLSTDGLLIVELPYFVENPFVLTVADHSTHFDEASIRNLLHSCGFEPLHLTSSWVPKELSIVARKGLSTTAPSSGRHVNPIPCVHWLAAVRDHALRIAQSSPNFGVFGTSIAGNWLYGEVNEHVRFFADEDISRSGKFMNGCPILLPKDATANSDLYITLPDQLVRGVVERLSKTFPGRIHTPPQGPVFPEESH